MCVASAGKGSVSAASFDSLLLTKAYGILTTHERYGAQVHVTPPAPAIGLPPPVLCTVFVQPAVFDFNGVTGELPGAQVGGLCMAVLDRKQVHDNKNNVAVLE